jgi:plastocyanin
MLMAAGNARARLATIAFAAMAVLAIGACGDDDEDTTTAATGATGATGAAGGGADTLAVSLTEYALDPANPTVDAGTLAIEVSNDGEIVHNLEVEGPAGEAELEEDLQPGDSDTLEVDLSEPGTYVWYCPVANHRDLGMEGEITVE